MKKKIFYSIFRTQWGWFGLLGSEGGLIRTCLPMKTQDDIRRSLLSGLVAPYKELPRFGSVQDDIISYFEGSYVNFGRALVCLDGYTAFQRNVLLALRSITYGKTITYADLAEMAENSGAVRAVGRVMAQNPLPLVIPCHRVIRKDGSLGGFSAQGGIRIKERMLRMENPQKSLGLKSPE